MPIPRDFESMTPEEREHWGTFLTMNGRVIWANPRDIGHFGVRLRKDILEEQIIERMYARARAPGSETD